MVDPQQQQGYPYPFRDQCIAVSLMIVRFYRGVSVQPVSLPATYDKQVSYVVALEYGIEIILPYPELLALLFFY